MSAGKNIIFRSPESKTTILSPGVTGKFCFKPIRRSDQNDRFPFEVISEDRRFDRRAKEIIIKQRDKQKLEKHQQLETTLVEVTHVSGTIFTQRDEEGNIILYEDPTDSAKNVERHDQFISIELYEDTFDINVASDVIDFSIIELKNIDNNLLNEFITTFRRVLPDIPNEELQFILRRGIEEQSGQLVPQEDFNRLTEGSFSTIIQRLLELQNESEIDTSEIESLTIQLEAMGELVLEASTNDSGFGLATLIQRVINELRVRNMVPGESSEKENLAIISVNARRFINNETLGKEFRNYGGTDSFTDFKEELVNDNVDLNRNPKDIDRDEARIQQQIDARNRERSNAEKNIEQDEDFGQNRDVDVVFLTEFGETKSLRLTLPFDVEVPIFTNIHGFPETVTGLRLRVVDTGAFRGWFINELKKTDATEYVTGILVPGTRFDLTAAYERYDDEGRDIRDDRFDDKTPEDDKQIVTLPEPPIDDSEPTDIIVPPVEPIKDQEPDRSEGSLTIEGGGKRIPDGHDPDVPILPLEDDEIPTSLLQ